VILPLVAFDQIDLAAANGCLVEWGHKMGPLERGNESGKHFALFENGRPVAVTMQSSLIRECVGGGQKSLTRANTCDRTCAASRFGSGVSLFSLCLAMTTLSVTRMLTCITETHTGSTAGNASPIATVVPTRGAAGKVAINGFGRGQQRALNL
jgi:hypothetical protein